MTDLVAEFCAWHHEYNSISKDRRSAQLRVLNALQASLGDRAISSLTADDFRSFLLACDVAPATVLKHIKMSRPFFRWMWERKHITGDQLMMLRGVQAPRGAGWAPPKPYSRGEIGQFWRDFELAYPWTRDEDPYDRTPKRGEYWVQRWQASPDPWEWKHVRPYARRLQAEAIVSLALFGGLRRVEIFRLELEDMHYENAYVRVFGARKNPGVEALERAVPMVTPLRVALSNWVEFRAQVLAPPHDRPWLSLWRAQYLEPMRASTLAHMLDKIGPGYELHRMRHTFATQRLHAGKGMPVETLQKIMGHANIAMTLRYTKIGVEDVLRVADQTNDDFAAALARGA